MVEPAADVAGLDLREGLLDDEALAVLGRTPRRPIERRVVERDENAVPGQLQVLLDVVGAQLDGEVVRRDGVFRRVAGGAAVTNRERWGILDLARLLRRGGREVARR